MLGGRNFNEFIQLDIPNTSMKVFTKMANKMPGLYVFYICNFRVMEGSKAWQTPFKQDFGHNHGV